MKPIKHESIIYVFGIVMVGYVLLYRPYMAFMAWFMILSVGSADFIGKSNTLYV